jgi:hypothetical protein
LTFIISTAFFNKNDHRRSRNNINELSNGYCKLTKLAVGGDKFYINQAIEFGRAGLEFTDVQFRSK